MQAQGHCTSNLTLFRNPPASLSLLTLLQRFIVDIATKHHHTSQLTLQAQKKLTPQADQEPEQYRSGHDWYSKLIKLNMNIGC
jgi:hypothetical protein